MDGHQDPVRQRRAELEELVPGSGIGAQIDRGAWMALSQGAPGTWSWGRAVATFVLAAVLMVILHFAVDSSIDWVIAVAFAYGLLLWRARTTHLRYLKRA